MKWFTAELMPGESNRAHVVIDHPIGSDWAPDWINDFMGEKPAKEFIQAVEALGDLDIIDLEINSPGGDVASGIRIFNYLRNHKATVHVRVTGMAASIATVIMMAGDTRTMAVGATIMTHRAASLMIGYFTAAEMEEHAKNVKTIDNEIVNVYAMTTGKSAEEIAALLDQGDTYMGADEALEWGFATDKDAQLQAVACTDPNLFIKQLKQEGKIRELQEQLGNGGGNQPMTAADALALAFDITPDEAEAQAADLGDKIIAMKKAASPETEADAANVVAKFIDQFPDLALAAQHSGEGKPVSLIAKALKMDEKDIVASPDKAVQAIDALRSSGGNPEEAVTAERARVTAIAKACQTTGQPQLLDKLIENGMAEDQASEYIYDVAAAGGNRQSIHNSHSPEGGQRAGIDYEKIYGRLKSNANA